MAIDFSLMIYSPCQNLFGRAVTVYPIASQPGQSSSYVARGILDTRGTAIQTDAGMVVMSDQQTILDIREIEFGIVPVQGDLVEIPAEASIPAAGLFEITDAAWNGGGEITLTLQRFEPPSETFVPGKR